jgi:PadR family transcriptional regulator, regulatory protein PadR
MGSGRNSGGELVQGTLDMLILKTLALGAMHGWGIARHIQQTSEEVLRVEEGSLYPALRRLELDGYLTAEWGASENNRRARYYTLTAQGRRRLVRESEHWDDLVRAITRVMRSA